MRKRQIPLEIQHFAAKKEAKAGYERSLEILNCSSSNSKIFPNSIPAPQALAAASTGPGIALERAKFRVWTAICAGARQQLGWGEGCGCFPLGKSSSSLARPGFGLRIAQARLELAPDLSIFTYPRKAGVKSSTGHLWHDLQILGSSLLQSRVVNYLQNYSRAEKMSPQGTESQEWERKRWHTRVPAPEGIAMGISQSEHCRIRN